MQSYFFSKAHFAKTQTRTYSLTCGPVGGTLPYARRICVDIPRHRQPMLDPLPPLGIVCTGGPNQGQVTVVSTRDGSWCGIPAISAAAARSLARPSSRSQVGTSSRCSESPARQIASFPSRRERRRRRQESRAVSGGLFPMPWKHAGNERVQPAAKRGRTSFAETGETHDHELCTQSDWTAPGLVDSSVHESGGIPTSLGL